jgi:hypothetical protein
MWALLRGCAAVVVRSTSGTSGWQPRFRMTASPGGPPRDSGRQAGIEVARWYVRLPRRCHRPSGRSPQGRDRARPRRDQRRAMYSRLSKVDKRGQGHEGLAEVRVLAGDGLCNGEQMVSFSASGDARHKDDTLSDPAKDHYVCLLRSARTAWNGRGWDGRPRGTPLCRDLGRAVGTSV